MQIGEVRLYAKLSEKVFRNARASCRDQSSDHPVSKPGRGMSNFSLLKDAVYVDVLAFKKL